MQRIVALLLAAFPIFLAMLGFKWMRDSVFAILNPIFPSVFLQFICALFLFLFGIYLFASFILHRDRKRNKVQKRFQQKQKTDA
ncbi:MAG: DUF2627 domain-containing protein [Bacillaceae bacterium]